MARVIHVLTNVDTHRRKAYCLGCGDDVDIRFRSDNKRWRCQTSERYQDRLRKYGVSPDSFDSLYEQAQGSCQICGRYVGPSLNVDHDHKTGMVRGLLCPECNLGLGNFGDSIKTLAKAIIYLEDHVQD